MIIKLDKSNPDTDGDTLKDGQEIVQRTDKYGERAYIQNFSQTQIKNKVELNWVKYEQKNWLFPMQL